MDALIESGRVTPGQEHVLPDQWAYLTALAQEAQLPDQHELARRFAKHREAYLAVGRLRGKLPGADDSYRRSSVSLDGPDGSGVVITMPGDGSL